MNINLDDPFEGLDDGAVIDHDAFDLESAAKRVYGAGPIGDTDGSGAVLVGEPGDGADIDMDTFEIVQENT